MYKQMDISDFMEMPKTQFEQIFEKVRNPVLDCANCLCNYCVNNAENVWRTVRPEEVQKPCFNCDECSIYDGNCRNRNKRKEGCMSFSISGAGTEYMARQNRKKIQLVKISDGKGKEDSYEQLVLDVLI